MREAPQMPDPVMPNMPPAGMPEMDPKKMKKIRMEMPDGTIGYFDSKEEAAEARRSFDVN